MAGAGALHENINRVLPWPTLFGAPDDMLNFWGVGDPIAGGKYQKEVDSCSLAPLRLVQAERQAAQLAVNVWWMLLVASTAGIIPSQNSANLLIARWVREFFSKCVPDHMIASVTLFTGLIGPYKGDGVMWQTRTPSKYASAFCYCYAAYALP